MMFDKILSSPIFPWQDGSGDLEDIILESRVRLCRNLKKYVFPNKASEPELVGIYNEGKQYMPVLNTLGHGLYEFIDIHELTPLQREVLVERHLTTAAHIANPEHRAIMLRDDGAVSILVNEDDHFCIQTMASGLALQRVWNEANQIDDSLESKMNFAFRDDYGYLTASPSLMGTGLVASVVLHLPALVAMKRLNRIVQGITKLGYAIGGVFFEQNESFGNLFQISNQVTLGVTEDDIISQLEKIVYQIVQEERNCRHSIWSENRDAVKDKVLRHYGVLTNAWMLEHREYVNILSDLRLAIDLGVVHERPQVYQALLTAGEAGNLQLSMGHALSEHDMNLRRASVARHMLQEYSI